MISINAALICFVKHFELSRTEKCYINKLALPCLAGETVKNTTVTATILAQQDELHGDIFHSIHLKFSSVSTTLFNQRYIQILPQFHL